MGFTEAQLDVQSLFHGVMDTCILTYAKVSHLCKSISLSHDFTHPKGFVTIS